MKLYYFQETFGNFGDDLNVPLWRELFPEVLTGTGEHLFLGIGTILNAGLPAATRYTVFGSGFGYGEPPQIQDSCWRFVCVRGPDTAAALGLPASTSVTDPALLVRHLVRVRAPSKRSGILFIPHHTTALRSDWRNYCRSVGLEYVEPSDPPLRVARRIARAKYVLSEAMHGAILADALRTPWRGVVTGDHINRAKWRDWAQTLVLDPGLIEIPAPDTTTSVGSVRWMTLTIRKSMRSCRLTPYRPQEWAVRNATQANSSDVKDALGEAVNQLRHDARLSADSVCDELQAELESRLQTLAGRPLFSSSGQ